MLIVSLNLNYKLRFYWLKNRESLNAFWALKWLRVLFKNRILLVIYRMNSMQGDIRGKYLLQKIALIWDRRSLSFRRDILIEIFNRVLANRSSVRHKAGGTDEEASTWWNGQALQINGNWMKFERERNIGYRSELWEWCFCQRRKTSLWNSG